MTTTHEVARILAQFVHEDFTAGVPERHASNSSLALAERLQQRGVVFRSPRRGDAKALRQIYSGLFFIYTYQDRKESTDHE